MVLNVIFIGFFLFFGGGGNVVCTGSANKPVLGPAFT